MIKFFKLWNGEEIVAYVDDGDGWCEKLEMRKPYRNVLTQQGSVLVPYPCDQILVATSHILFSGAANDELTRAYTQVTSGMVLPPKGLQIPH